MGGGWVTLTCSRLLFSLRHLLICERGFESDLRRFLMPPAPGALGPSALPLPFADAAPAADERSPAAVGLLLTLPPSDEEDEQGAAGAWAGGALPRPATRGPPLSVFMLAQRGSDGSDSHGSEPRLLVGQRGNL